MKKQRLPIVIGMLLAALLFNIQVTFAQGEQASNDPYAGVIAFILFLIPFGIVAAIALLGLNKSWKK